MANRGYDVVVDVDEEGDLGHTDLQEDLEFHSSNFENPNARNSKIPPDNTTFLNSGPSRSSSSANGSSKRYLWSLSYYSQFFDVDTGEVVKRCLAAINPLRANFLDVLEGNPDLYGPVWIATTVVLILFLAGTINKYLGDHGKGHFEYDFRLLSGAAGLIYGYTLIIPSLLFLALKYLGSESANLLEVLALYGYSNLIWLPVAVISWSPVQALNYIFVAFGFVASTAFLMRNLWPVLSGARDLKTSRVLAAVLIALHAGLAIAIKITFFPHGSPAKKDHDKDDKGDKKDDKDDDDDKMRRMLFGM